jgi:Spy/CpxP family protein refolding chaperone
MRLTTKLLVAAAIAVAGATASQAMPLASADSISAASPIQQIGWRCGPGWHMNGWGRCVPNRAWRPYRRYWW